MGLVWRAVLAKQLLLPYIILVLGHTGITYENVMLRIYYFVITDLFISFTCSPAGNFSVIQIYTYNDNQIEQYGVYVIIFILMKPICREMW